MSTGDQRVHDSIRLTADAVLSGRIAALEDVRLKLAERQEANDETVASGATATDKMKARGANEEISNLLQYIAREVDAAQANRDT